MLFLLGVIDLRYGDESSFNLEPNIPYGWIKKGKNKELPSRKGGTLNVFGLLNLLGELTTYQTTGTVNSKVVIGWLDDFCQTIEKTTVVVLDNAPWHTSEIFKEKISEWESKGLFIVYLPIYSPLPIAIGINPTEILWRKTKYKWLRPEDFSSKENLHQRLNHIFKNYNSEEFSIEFKVDFNIDYNTLEKCKDTFV